VAACAGARRRVSVRAHGRVRAERSSGPSPDAHDRIDTCHIISARARQGPARGAGRGRARPGGLLQRVGGRREHRPAAARGAGGLAAAPAGGVGAHGAALLHPAASAGRGSRARACPPLRALSRLAWFCSHSPALTIAYVHNRPPDTKSRHLRGMAPRAERVCTMPRCGWRRCTTSSCARRTGTRATLWCARPAAAVELWTRMRLRCCAHVCVLHRTVLGSRRMLITGLHAEPVSHACCGPRLRAHATCACGALGCTRAASGGSHAG